MNISITPKSSTPKRHTKKNGISLNASFERLILIRPIKDSALIQFFYTFKHKHGIGVGMEVIRTEKIYSLSHHGYPALRDSTLTWFEFQKSFLNIESVDISPPRKTFGKSMKSLRGRIKRCS